MQGSKLVTSHEAFGGWVLCSGAIALAAILGGCGGAKTEPQAPAAQATGLPEYPAPPMGSASAAPPASTGPGPVEVLLCDGQTKVTVPAGTAGTSVAGALMTEWLRKNPNANWEAEERERHTLQP